MPPPKLLEQYRERLRVKHYSLRTEDAYARAQQGRARRAEPA